jgi:hypothetical protein
MGNPHGFGHMGFTQRYAGSIMFYMKDGKLLILLVRPARLEFETF